MSFKRVFLIIFLLCTTCCSVLFSQNNTHRKGSQDQKDSLVRLVEANSAELVQVDSMPFRKIIGPARFLHNNTYLLCDTASWDITNNIIYALGHVQIIQQNTFLTSESVRYVVARDVAEFRGEVVQLIDKDHNILKTRYLDYNTKDSTALFYNGGVMKTKDENIIEGINGTYDARQKLFTFELNVQMYSDSLFAKSDKIDYKTQLKKAYFGNNTMAWQKLDFLRTDNGEYDRRSQEFMFDRNNYIYTDTQEIWADVIKYNRKSGNAILNGNVQVQDTVQSVIMFADNAVYNKTPMVVELTQKPSLGMYSVENGVADTLYISGDTLKYYTFRHCDIDTTQIAAAKARKSNVEIDVLENLKKEVANNIAQKRAQFAADTDQKPNNLQLASHKDPITESGKSNKIKPEIPSKGVDTLAKGLDTLARRADTLAKSSAVPPKVADTLSKGVDTLAKGLDTLAHRADTLANGLDTLANMANTITIHDSTKFVKDTMQVKFIDAWNNVKVFRTDLQALCDTLKYSGLDSIAGFYHNPIMWSDIKNQFTADTIFTLLKKDSLYKSDLVGNAFIISQEDSIHFNQVKSTEMMAYFRNNDIWRYDALGGASAVFYFREDSIVTLMNQKEAKILSALIANREIQKIRYYEQIKSDVSPIYNLPIDKQRLRDFNWRSDERPKDRYEVTQRGVVQSERDRMFKMEMPLYPYLNFYFPKDGAKIVKERNLVDSIAQAKESARIEAWNKRVAEKQAREIARADSLRIKDSLSIAERTHTIDSLSVVNNNVDSVSVVSTDNNNKAKLSRQQRKEQKLIKREKRKELRAARREKRIALRKERAQKRAERAAKRLLSRKNLQIPIL